MLLLGKWSSQKLAVVFWDQYYGLRQKHGQSFTSACQDFLLAHQRKSGAAATREAEQYSDTTTQHPPK